MRAKVAAILQIEFVDGVFSYPDARSPSCNAIRKARRMNFEKAAAVLGPLNR